MDREIVGCHFLLQGIFPTWRLNLSLLHCQTDSLPLNHQGKWKWKWSGSVLSDSLRTPGTLAYQAPQSVGFSRQEYWSGLLFAATPQPPLSPRPRSVYLYTRICSSYLRCFPFSTLKEGPISASWPMHDDTLCWAFRVVLSGSPNWQLSPSHCPSPPSPSHCPSSWAPLEGRPFSQCPAAGAVRVVIAKHCGLRGLNSRNLFPQLRRLEVQAQSVVRVHFFWGLSPWFAIGCLLAVSLHNSLCCVQYVSFFFFFLRYVDVDHFKSLYWLCYNVASVSCFWFADQEVCRILAPWQGIRPSPPAVKGEVLTTGPPGKSLYVS